MLQQRGFNAIFQDVRGTHESAGNFSMFLLDGSDGHATMEWIAQQSWHLGGIVTNGMSALGIAQFAVAVLRSPHHAGMWIDWASPSGKSPFRPFHFSFKSFLFPARIHSSRASRHASNLLPPVSLAPQIKPIFGSHSRRSVLPALLSPGLLPPA